MFSVIRDDESAEVHGFASIRNVVAAGITSIGTYGESHSIAVTGYSIVLPRDHHSDTNDNNNNNNNRSYTLSYQHRGRKCVIDCIQHAIEQLGYTLDETTITADCCGSSRGSSSSSINNKLQAASLILQLFTDYESLDKRKRLGGIRCWSLDVLACRSSESPSIGRLQVQALATCYKQASGSQPIWHTLFSDSNDIGFLTTRYSQVANAKSLDDIAEMLLALTPLFDALSVLGFSDAEKLQLLKVLYGIHRAKSPQGYQQISFFGIMNSVCDGP
jgi:hypothetical protein